MAPIKEIELKFKLTEEDKAALLSRLNELSAKHEGHKKEIDYYYARQGRDFMQTKECLRIRYTPDYTEITYKPATTEEMKEAQSFWKKEINLRIDGQLEQAREFLQGLGCIEFVKVAKERDTYKLNEVIIALDYIEGVRWFAELEIQDENEMNALAALKKCAQELNIKSESIVTEPYRDLCMKKDIVDTSSPAPRGEA
ncbi:MAG: class IV adenylate cyclase [Nitrospirae bacterium]|nr:class IV adenylate cyclase [Nitrospirota bacterium]